MESNWFYSTLAQSAAAIIGIISAFMINKIMNNLSIAEKSVINWKIYEKNIIVTIHKICEKRDEYLKSIVNIRRERYLRRGDYSDSMKRIMLTDYFDSMEEIDDDIKNTNYQNSFTEKDVQTASELRQYQNLIKSSIGEMLKIERNIGYLQSSINMIHILNWIILFAFTLFVAFPIIVMSNCNLGQIILVIAFVIIFLLIISILDHYNFKSKITKKILDKYNHLQGTQSFSDWLHKT